jgi:cytochrome b561
VRARDTAVSWGWVTRGLHWVMAGLILFQLGLGLWMTREQMDLLTRFDLTQLHKSWGVVIFALALVRIGWRLVNRRRPDPPPTMPAWQRRAARASHAALYLLMVLLPFSGWVQAAAAPEQDILGIRNMVFGLFALPDPWQPGVKAIAETAGAVHSSCAWTLLAVLAMHAGAALLHQFHGRDRVLARMTFGR